VKARKHGSNADVRKQDRGFSPCCVAERPPSAVFESPQSPAPVRSVAVLSAILPSPNCICKMADIGMSRKLHSPTCQNQTDLSPIPGLRAHAYNGPSLSSLGSQQRLRYVGFFTRKSSSRPFQDFTPTWSSNPSR